METAKRVSEAIKNVGYRGSYHKRMVAQNFAQKMRGQAERVRKFGTHNAFMAKYPPLFDRTIVNALCFGCGDEHNRRMIKKYTEAAKAAERFCRK